MLNSIECFLRVEECHVCFSSLVAEGTDLSDIQLRGLEDAIGEETVDKVMKGCQVCSNQNWCMLVYNI